MIVNKKFTHNIFPGSVIGLKGAIVLELVAGEKDSLELMDLVARPFDATKQAYYKALRELIKEEQVIKHGRRVSLNIVWIAKIAKFVEQAESAYGIVKRLSKREGRIQSYTFTSTTELDIYWAHLFLLLAEELKGEPIFFYNYHEWFMYDRPEAENNLFDLIKKKRHQLFTTLGVQTPMAISFKKKYQTDTVQVAIDESFNFPLTDNIVVMGDYIITTRYDEKVANEIDILFRALKVYDEEADKKLRAILSKHRKSKILVDHNKSKAHILKKRFTKNFVIPKNLEDKI